jgi:hypothetical protein
MQPRRKSADRDCGGLILRTAGAGFIKQHDVFPWLLGGIVRPVKASLSARRPATGDAATLLPLQTKIKETAAAQAFSSTAIICKQCKANEIAGLNCRPEGRLLPLRDFGLIG